MSHLAAAGGCRRVDRLRGRLDELTRRVLDAGKADAGAGGKIQLGVADRAGRVSQLSRQVLRTLEGLAYRPFWRFAAAGRGKKFRTDFCKIVREDVIGALAVSAVEDVNRKFGEFHFWIEFRDGRIVPGFDFPEKNIGHYGPGEFELVLHRAVRRSLQFRSAQPAIRELVSSRRGAVLRGWARLRRRNRRNRHAGAGGHQHGFFLALGDGRKKKAQYKKSNKKPVQSR